MSLNNPINPIHNPEHPVQTKGKKSMNAIGTRQTIYLKKRKQYV